MARRSSTTATTKPYPEATETTATKRSAVQRRMEDSATAIMGDAADDPAFLHVIFAQIGLPYREPESATWERRTGRAAMILQAGHLWHPRRREFLPQGLPYGTRPRLLLAHLCTEALRLGSPVVPVADSFTGFMRELGITPTGGKEGSVGRFREQMNRLTASRMQMAMHYGDGRRDFQMNPAPAIASAELWGATDPRQRVIWPAEVTLSREFFDGLQRYALPFDPRAYGALSHSARALDLYTWLAHRLPRVKEHAGAFISWGALAEQFGGAGDDLREFRRAMVTALRQVLAVYPAAQVMQIPGGLKLFRSAPAIARKASVRGARVGPVVIDGTAEPAEP